MIYIFLKDDIGWKLRNAFLMIFFSSNQSNQKILPFCVPIKNEKQVESVIFQLRSLKALRLKGFILLSQLEAQ